MKSDNNEHMEYCQDEPSDVEAIPGTIIVPEKEQESRLALRPQASSDPNDPLVSLQASLVITSNRY